MIRFVALVAVLAVILGVPAVAVAQEASPVAEPSLLSELGFAEFVLDTDGVDFSAPESIDAGRYRFVINNSSAERSADVLAVQVPEGMTADDVIALATAADEQETPPEEIFSLTFVGGAYAFPESAGDSIVTFTPGEWLLDFSAYSETDDSVEEVRIYRPFTVTGELPEVTDPEASVVATASELHFDFPESMAAGPQVWEFTNAGSFLHHMVIVSYPGTVTPEQVEGLMSSFSGMPATPEASPVAALNPDDFIFVGQAQVLSTGQSNWFQLDLEPGTHIAFCFVSGPGDVPTHAAAGMFRIFTVQ